MDIIHKGTLLAKIIRKEDYPNPGLHFVTEPENSLQVSVLNHPKGYKVEPHIHKERERIIKEVQEVLYLESGLVFVRLFDEEGSWVSGILMDPGDTIILVKGGHGFEFMEDSKMMYVKQGPYYGKEEDKKLL